MSWHFSRAQVEEYLEATSSDGERFAPSSGNPTPQLYLPKDRMTAFSRLSRFGMTFGLLTDDLGAELLTWFRAGFPVRTSALRGGVKDLTGNDRDYGGKWPASLAKFDLESRGWKTHQCSLLGGLESYSGTWPKWGTMLNGECWELTILEPTIKEPEYGFLPTPQKSDGKIVREFSAQSAYRNRVNGHQVHVPHIALMKKKPLLILLSDIQSMMGWPESWTSLKPLAMARFQQWLDSHGRPLHVGDVIDFDAIRSVS